MNIDERIKTFYERLDQLEERLPESKEGNWERSRSRWRRTKPTVGLTWGIEVTGDEFIAKVSSHDVFDPETTILEIGPGYGRLLKSCVEQKLPFQKYVAVDLSIDNVQYLQHNFRMANVNTIHADVEKVSFEESFDVVLSSLTFKHLFPSFENLLRNVLKYVNDGGMFFFDLIEGRKRFFETDKPESEIAFVRWYTRSEILEILESVSLELVAFDQVQHDPDHSRLLVVARKPAVS